MSPVPQQLALDLPHRSAMGREDFMVSVSNAAAVDAIDAWQTWSGSSLAIVGPAGAGKSHLVEVWRAQAGAELVAAAELGEDAVGQATQARAVAVEDIDRGIGDERALFHLLNLARETSLSVLMTSRAAPGEIDIALPDLRSRLRALALVKIDTPDQALLRALLVKLFADRQLKVEPHVIAHLSLQMERSAEAANRVVAEIDRLTLQKRRKITRAIATEALAAVATREDYQAKG